MPAIRDCQEELAQGDERAAFDYDVRIGMGHRCQMGIDPERINTSFRYFSNSCAILFKHTWVVPPPIDQPLTSL